MTTFDDEFNFVSISTYSWGIFFKSSKRYDFESLTNYRIIYPLIVRKLKAFDAFSGVAKLGVCSLYQTHASSGIITDEGLLKESYFEIVHTQP